MVDMQHFQKGNEEHAKRTGEPVAQAPSNAQIQAQAGGFFDRLETLARSFDYRHKLPSGDTLVFRFPASIMALREISEAMTAIEADAGELSEAAGDLSGEMRGAALLMGRTNTEIRREFVDGEVETNPGLDTTAFLRMAREFGIVFFAIAPNVVKAFQRACALQPVEDIKSGKDA